MNETVYMDMKNVNDVKVSSRLITKLLNEGYDIVKIIPFANNTIFEIQLKK